MEGTQDDGTLAGVAAAIRVAGIPLRLEILRMMRERRRLSPSQFAAGGGATLRESAYHFRHLRDGGLIVLHDVETSGGTAQHFYALSPMGRAVVGVLPRLAKALAGAD
ncbi:MAG TPA: helix-turn-helix domain-containing protein [Solirubrobacteraceae bacterium]|nr:helix-turn-helix domain-containing protein [Solirubrobacteraceae bacterium]